MNHFFIIAGGSIQDKFAVNYLAAAEKKQMIAADSGLEFCYRNQILPQFAVGDFDSVTQETLAWFQKQEGICWQTLNPQKDDTDTEHALRMAIEAGADQITILGGTGSRLDHVLGNIELLGIGIQEKTAIELVDAHNRIRMINQGITIEKEKQFGKYVSFIPYTDCVEHLSLKGFQYELSDACLRGFCSLGVSNEITAREAVIEFETGILLVIESRDEER